MKRSLPLCLLSLAFLTGCASLQGRFSQELSQTGLPDSPALALVQEADLRGLPASVQRYMHFMGVVGHPRDWSFRWVWSGHFRRSPSEAFVNCEAIQYDNALSLSRIFQMQLPVMGLPTTVRDTYLRGKGRMQGKVFDLFPVVDASSEEIALGELVTYLNDCILVAPSMLLTPACRWSAVDEQSFDVAISDGGRTAKARVFLDQEGGVVDFSTTDRFVEDPNDPKHPLIRCEWRTPVGGWTLYEGRRFPTRGQATWMLPQGPFTYCEIALSPEGFSFNVPAK